MTHLHKWVLLGKGSKGAPEWADEAKGGAPSNADDPLDYSPSLMFMDDSKKLSEDDGGENESSRVGVQSLSQEFGGDSSARGNGFLQEKFSDDTSEEDEEPLLNDKMLSKGNRLWVHDDAVRFINENGHTEIIGDQEDVFRNDKTLRDRDVWEIARERSISVVAGVPLRHVRVA
ncbi:MAG: hypothetical protein M1837_002368 [Sclerophora amabilis]|nr:MAG: hypothetical protein M1837_002368 [Sclerophora amabilis]